MTVVTSSLVSALHVGFQREFQDALLSVPSQWDRLSIHVLSSSAGNTYGWIGQFPKLHKWFGDRSFKNIRKHDYSVMDNLYKATVDIPRTAVEGDDIGVYTPLFREMGYTARTYPDGIVFGLLENGMSSTCYDGKTLFAVNHPVYLSADGSGNAGTISNWLCPTAADGTVTNETPQFVLDVSRPLCPFVFQGHIASELQVITNPNNDYVSMKDRIPYGIRYRCNGGCGFWQQAVYSTQELNAASFAVVLETMQSFRTDGGRPLSLGFGGEAGAMLVMPPSLQSAARRVVSAEQDPNGGNSIWYHVTALLISHRLI